MRTFEDVELMVLRNDIQGLIVAASDPDETIRWLAVKALRSLNPPQAREVIQNAQYDAHSIVRRAALGLEDKKVKKCNLRWLWIMVGTWGVSSILLAMLILFLMFSDGNFAFTSLIFAILVSGIFGGVLLRVAVVKLREKGDE